MPSDIDALLDAAVCNKCIPVGMQNEVIIYLLQQLTGNTETAQQLMDNSRCNKCIPKGMQMEVIIYLLDAYVNP